MEAALLGGGGDDDDGACEPSVAEVRNKAAAAMEAALLGSGGDNDDGACELSVAEVRNKAVAAMEAALLGGGGDDDGACELSVAELQEVEAVFNNCIEMHAGRIPASAAAQLLESLSFSARRLSIVETSLAQAKAAGAFLDLREFSRLALLLRDAGSPKSEPLLSGSLASGSPSSGSPTSPLFGSPAKALRRSRSLGSIASEPKPQGRVASLREPLEPLPQILRRTSRGSGRRQFRRCSSVCLFDQRLAPPSVSAIY
jgi:hypothetical protein